jgi:hypothetical protein
VFDREAVFGPELERVGLRGSEGTGSEAALRRETAEILRSDFFTICRVFPRNSPFFFQKKVGFWRGAAP